MPHFRHHGGECCGVKHILNFPVPSYMNHVQKCKAIEKPMRGWRGRLLEVVLTDCQIHVWGDALKEVGFIPVARWLNSNSSKYCTMFVWYRPVSSPIPGAEWPKTPAITFRSMREWIHRLMRWTGE